MWHWKELFSFGFAVKYELTCVDVIIFSPPPSSLYKRHLFNGLAPSLQDKLKQQILLTSKIQYLFPEFHWCLLSIHYCMPGLSLCMRLLWEVSKLGGVNSSHLNLILLLYVKDHCFRTVRGLENKSQLGHEGLNLIASRRKEPCSPTSHNTLTHKGQCFFCQLFKHTRITQVYH